MTDKRHILNRLFPALNRHLTAQAKRREDKAIDRRSLDFVRVKLDRWARDGKYRENYSSIDEILAELDVTGEELASFCSKRLHKRFFTWRKELRIREAQELIISRPDSTLKEIAFHVGICDKTNFRKQFKSIAGCTPREWRESHAR